MFYGNDSSVMVYSLDTKTTEYLSNSDDNLNDFNEYNAFYDFVNNLDLAKANETWRSNYGVTLNSYGNIGCTVEDNCYNNNISAFNTPQCDNLFEALTGQNPIDILYDFTQVIYSNTCFYISNENQKVIEYNFKLGDVSVKTFYDYPIENILDENNYDSNLSLFNYMTNYANLEDVLKCEFGIIDTYKFGIYSNKIGVSGNGSECVLTMYNGGVNFRYDNTLEKYMFVSMESLPAEF